MQTRSDQTPAPVVGADVARQPALSTVVLSVHAADGTVHTTVVGGGSDTSWVADAVQERWA